MCSHTIKDKILNDVMCEKIGVEGKKWQKKSIKTLLACTKKAKINVS